MSPFPQRSPCSIAISGPEDEALELAVLHAGTVHGHQDTPGLREQIRSMLQDENAATAKRHSLKTKKARFPARLSSQKQHKIRDLIPD